MRSNSAITTLCVVLFAAVAYGDGESTNLEAVDAGSGDIELHLIDSICYGMCDRADSLITESGETCSCGAECIDDNTCCPGRHNYCDVREKDTFLPSLSVCEDLPTFEKKKSELVCAASKINGECATNVSPSNANAMCLVVGGRLCTMAEIMLDSAMATGCNLNRKPVWTSSPCGDNGEGLIVGSGAAENNLSSWLVNAQCLDETSTAGVRCCADAKPAPATTLRPVSTVQHMDVTAFTTTATAVKDVTTTTVSTAPTGTIVDEFDFAAFFSNTEGSSNKKTQVWPIAVAVSCGLAIILVIFIMCIVKVKKAKKSKTRMRGFSEAFVKPLHLKKEIPSFVDESAEGADGETKDKKSSATKRTVSQSSDASREYQSPDHDSDEIDESNNPASPPKELDWDVYNVATMTVKATPQTGVDVFGNKVETPVFESMEIGNIRVVPGKAMSHKPPVYNEAMTSESDPVHNLTGHTVSDSNTEEYVPMDSPGPFIEKGDGNVEC